MASSDMQNEAPLKYGNGQPDSHTGHRDQARFSISGLSLPILAAGHNGTFDASLGPTTTGSMTANVSVVRLPPFRHLRCPCQEAESISIPWP